MATKYTKFFPFLPSLPYAPTTTATATMGIPKSDRVDLDAFRTNDPIGLGLAIPPPANAPIQLPSPPNKGFRVLSRPTSHQPSPVIPHLPMLPDNGAPIMTGEMTPELASLVSSRNNSGSSTPSRFITPLGGSVSNLSSMLTRPLTGVGRARERYEEGEELDATPPAPTAATTTTTSTTTTTTGNESDIDTEPVPVPLQKQHSLRDLLIDTLSHSHHHHHQTPQDPPHPPFRNTGYQVRRSLDLSGPASYTAPSATAMRRPAAANRAQSEIRGLTGLEQQRQRMAGEDALAESRGPSEWEEEDQV